MAPEIVSGKFDDMVTHSLSDIVLGLTSKILNQNAEVHSMKSSRGRFFNPPWRSYRVSSIVISNLNKDAAAFGKDR